MCIIFNSLILIKDTIHLLSGKCRCVADVVLFILALHPNGATGTRSKLFISYTCLYSDSPGLRCDCHNIFSAMVTLGKRQSQK